jgi:hypothetical protein
VLGGLFGRKRSGMRLLRALVTALEGIHAELVALRTHMERGGAGSGATEQGMRAFRTSRPLEGAPKLRDVVPQDLAGNLVAHQEAAERLRDALGREPDELEVIREVERSA